MHGSLTFCTQQFRSFNSWYPSILLAKSWKLHKLVNLIGSFNFCIYSYIRHGFYELSRMLMRKNFNNEIQQRFTYIINTIPEGKCFVRYLSVRFCIRNLTRSLRYTILYVNNYCGSVMKCVMKCLCVKISGVLSRYDPGITYFRTFI